MVASYSTCLEISCFTERRCRLEKTCIIDERGAPAEAHDALLASPSSCKVAAAEEEDASASFSASGRWMAKKMVAPSCMRYAKAPYS